MFGIIRQKNTKIVEYRAKGKDGENGKSPISLVITPSTFVFNTDIEGNIEGIAANEGKIKLFVGDIEVLPDNVKILSSINCNIAVSGGNKIKFLSITPDKWSGSAVIEVEYKEHKKKCGCRIYSRCAELE